VIVERERWANGYAVKETTLAVKETALAVKETTLEVLTEAAGMLPTKATDACEPADY
jgi:hypothetical protein